MKKKMLSLFLCIVLVLSGSGCGAKAGDQESRLEDGRGQA